MRIESSPTSGANHNFLFALYYLFKLAGLLGSCFAIYLGYKLFILGVTGQASISVESQKVSGQLLNAAPGLFFAVGGIVALIVCIWKGVDVDYGQGNRKVR